MDPSDLFEKHLRTALAHLYDPSYQPPQSLWTALDCDPRQEVGTLQTVLIEAIESLHPPPDTPPTARIKRIYDLLSYRYVQDLTQEEAAERLGITPRHLRREQREAVHVLAQHLWRRIHRETSPADGFPAGDEMPSPEYRLQLRQEVASLEKMAPGSVADVGETIRSVVQLGSTLTAKHNVELEAALVDPGLAAAIHPSALRQVLIMAIGNLTQCMSSGQISLWAERRDSRVRITVTGRPAITGQMLGDDFMQEILAIQGGTVELDIEGDQASFCVELPPADTVTVLVVDDNLDLIHFYRRYTTGTRYQIAHVAEAQQVFEAVKEHTPDIVVLDVMLPDSDGWELLTHLRKHPATQSIPIIVCSVIREEELALALGATLYVPKPVRRQQFVQALGQALNQAATKAPTSPVNNATTY